MPYRIAIATLGCKVNQADSEGLAADFEAAGCLVVEADQPADAYVVNTCTVTLVADRKARKLVRGVAAPNPQALVAVCGCYAEGLGRAVLEAMPEVDVVRGTSDRRSLPEAVLLELRRRESAGLLSRVQAGYRPAEPRVRAQLKVQDGCTQGCSYCIVPSVRGPLASRSPQSVLAEAATRLAAGARELVLCGIRLGAYGVDRLAGRASRFEPLCALVEQLAELPDLLRLRLGSILPLDLSPRLLNVMAAQPAVCRHLHLPLQSGDDTVLRAMRRRYSSGRFLALAERARELLGDVALTSDVMVGFPGETRAAFEQTLAVVEKAKLADLHIFAYSARPGTLAATWPDDVPPAEKAARAAELGRLRADLWRARHEPRLGGQAELLVESVSADGDFEGLTDDYLRVRATGAQNLAAGQLATVQLRHLKGDHAAGQLVEAHV